MVKQKSLRCEREQLQLQFPSPESELQINKIYKINYGEKDTLIIKIKVSVIVYYLILMINKYVKFKK